MYKRGGGVEESERERGGWVVVGGARGQRGSERVGVRERGREGGRETENLSVTMKWSSNGRTI